MFRSGDEYHNKRIGNIPVNELKRADVLKALRSIQTKGLSRNSIENARNVDIAEAF